MENGVGFGDHTPRMRPGVEVAARELVSGAREPLVHWRGRHG